MGAPAGETERALVRAVEERDYLLANVRCLLWRAEVCEEAGRLEWRFSYVNEDAAWRYFPLRDAGLLPDGTRSFARALRLSRVPEDRERMRALAWQRFHANESYAQDYRVYTAAQDVRWLRERVEVRPLGPGRWEAIGVTVDVTEQRQLEEGRVARERELGAARVRAMSEYFSVASHELRTPVTTVKAYAQLLLRRFERGDSNQDALARVLRTIDSQASRLTRLIEHLLDANRLELGRLRLERAPTAVDALVRRVIEDTAVRHPAARIRLVVEGAPPVEAVVDALRLEQVLVNLLDNALRHGGAGRPVDVSVAAQAHAGTHGVRIAVRDRGPGIPPALRDAIFEPFRQSRPDSHVTGLGLGLFVSRQIAELHGGWLRAQDPGDARGGARFALWLPTDGEAPDTGELHQLQP